MQLSHHFSQQLADRPVVGRDRLSDVRELGEREQGRLVARVDDAAGAHLEEEAFDEGREHDLEVAPLFRGKRDLESCRSELRLAANRLLLYTNPYQLYEDRI